MKYPESLKAHLAHYKRSVLDVAEDGLWSRNGRAYPHILPKNSWQLNLVEPFRERCAQHVTDQGIERHRDFHHLNSSQAFALNLFFPFLAGSADSQRALATALALESGIQKWEFESVPDPEEGTNFDLRLELTSGAQVFIEVKLTEAGFGTCRPTNRHRDKLKNIYTSRLAGRVSTADLAEDRFFEHYQLLRNLSYADPKTGRTLLLVFPKANEKAEREARSFLEHMIREKYRPAVRVLHVEELFRRLGSAPEPGAETRTALAQVGSKYMLS